MGLEGSEEVVCPNAFRGTFTKDLRTMQYGYGDDESPLQETVCVVVGVRSGMYACMYVNVCMHITPCNMRSFSSVCLPWAAEGSVLFHAMSTAKSEDVRVCTNCMNLYPMLLFFKL
jgi:hypothetical protein